MKNADKNKRIPFLFKPESEVHNLYAEIIASAFEFFNIFDFMGIFNLLCMRNKILNMSKQNGILNFFQVLSKTLAEFNFQLLSSRI